ncbi:urokinase plasminogen activator surface receptor-like isoform X2 [Oculina patagonica]
MKQILVYCAVFLCSTFIAAGGIKCYNCINYSDECTKDKLVADKAKYLETCPLSEDRCMTFWIKEDDSVVKMCSTKSLCDYSKKTCDDMKDGECAFNCCDTDECNAGSPELPTGSIKCYDCIGTGDECAKDKLVADKAKYLATCPLSEDRCITVWAKKDDQTSVVKACSTKSLCDYAKKTCDDMKDGECAFNCCDTDECNAGSPELPTGSIKCYDCIGTGDECAKDKLVADKAKYLATCPLSEDRCITVWAKKDDQTSVVKACSTKSLCDYAKKTCDDMKDGECAFNCCDTDECNAGSPELPTGSIKCYDCIGTGDECAKDKLVADKAKYLATCPLSEDRCITVWAKKDDQTSVVKACSTKSLCDYAKKTCDDMKDGECAFNCCDTDECNAGSPELPTGSIKCYDCIGTGDECAKDKLVADKAKYLATCPLSEDRCITVWAKKDDQTSVVKACSTKSLCDYAKKTCDDMKDGECAFNCCDTDECNAGSPGLPNSK